MADEKTQRPDLAAGVRMSDIDARTGMLLGRVTDEDVLLVRTGDDLFAVGAHCTHYHGDLAGGLVVGDTVRCPLHHACFSLRTGEAVRAPALDPIASWHVERQGDRVFVRGKRPARPVPAPSAGAPASVGIIGGGAAGLAAADMLRREGYEGEVTIISADGDAPVDRPNLSKDFLAGEAKEDWIPLWPPDLYAERRVGLELGRRVTDLNAEDRAVGLDDGSRRSFGAILLATGAEPVRLAITGADRPHVHYLRSYADSRAIVGAVGAARRAVVVGASFIGLEVAASLRARGLAVDVVAPERAPLEKVMGFEVGRFVQSVHESQGVVFHLGQTLQSIGESSVTLIGGGTLRADVVVVGIGVRPVTTLAEQAGLETDRGIAVDEYLETSAPQVFAAGDVARWPDPHTGKRIRVEHWVVAQRQGQTAARNMLGRREPFDAVPFFWSRHYDVTIHYVGHAERWDTLTIDGSLDDRDCRVSYLAGGKLLAVVAVGRSREGLAAEAELERQSVLSADS